ncbi:MAG: hypothetical protein RLY89_2967, partial [Bacteroidota bacterium]
MLTLTLTGRTYGKLTKRLGDIEVDLMMGKNHKGALLVMTDRASLYTRIVKLSGKS